MYYVYILKNEKGEKYIGTTQDLKNRLQEHNNGETKTIKNKVLGMRLQAITLYNLCNR